MNLTLSEMQKHEYWMGLALQQARNAAENDEVPVGAVLVDKEGKELAQRYNQKEMLHNSIAHAEILCISRSLRQITKLEIKGLYSLCDSRALHDVSGSINSGKD